MKVISLYSIEKKIVSFVSIESNWNWRRESHTARPWWDCPIRKSFSQIINNGDYSLRFTIACEKEPTTTTTKMDHFLFLDIYSPREYFLREFIYEEQNIRKVLKINRWANIFFFNFHSFGGLCLCNLWRILCIVYSTCANRCSCISHCLLVETVLSGPFYDDDASTKKKRLNGAINSMNEMIDLLRDNLFWFGLC